MSRVYLELSRDTLTLKRIVIVDKYILEGCENYK